jgi:hypothetical protein
MGRRNILHFPIPFPSPKKKLEDNPRIPRIVCERREYSSFTDQKKKKKTGWIRDSNLNRKTPRHSFFLCVQSKEGKKKESGRGNISCGILDKNQSNMQTKCHHRILGEGRSYSCVAFAGKAQSAGDMSYTSFPPMCYVLFFSDTQTARESTGGNKQSQKPNQNSSVGDKYNVLIYCPDQNSRRNGSLRYFRWLVGSHFSAPSFTRHYIIPAATPHQ